MSSQDSIVHALFVPPERLGWIYCNPPDEEALVKVPPQPDRQVAQSSSAVVNDDVITQGRVALFSGLAGVGMLLGAASHALVVMFALAAVSVFLLGRSFAGKDREHEDSSLGVSFLVLFTPVIIVVTFVNSVVASILMLSIPALGFLRAFVLLGAESRAQARLDRRLREAQGGFDKEYKHQLSAWKRNVGEINRANQDQSEHRLRLLRTWRYWQSALLPDPSSLLSVFGGSAYGWENLLTTLGTSLLGAGERVVLVNISGREVTQELQQVASRTGHSRTELGLPDAQGNLIGGFSADDVVQLLSNVIHADESRVPRTQVSTTQRYLRQVSRRLNGPLTVPRVAAALRIVLRQFVEDNSILEQSEIDSLLEDPYFTEQTVNQIRGELLNLEHTLSDLGALLPSVATGADSGLQLARENSAFASELCVINIPRAFHAQTHALGADLILQLLLSHFKSGYLRSNTGTTIILVGADRVEARHLKDLWRGSRISVDTPEGLRERQPRIVYLFEELDGSAGDFVGYGGGAAAFMRLGQADSAEKASKFVGLEHIFRVASLTKNTSESWTHSDGTQFTQTDGDQTTTTNSRTKPADALFARGQVGNSLARGTSRSRAWGTTQSKARSLSEGQSETLQRVHEYKVEPTVIQGLPETSLLFLEHVSGDGPILIDCNPDIVSLTLDMSAAEDRSALESSRPKSEKKSRADYALAIKEGPSSSLSTRPGRIRRIVLALFVFPLLLAAAFAGGLQYYYRSTIYPGVRISDTKINLGGMSRAEAIAALLPIDASQRVRIAIITLPGHSPIRVPVYRLGYYLDRGKLANRAFAVGRSGAVLQRLHDLFIGLVQGTSVTIVRRVNGTVLLKYLFDLASSVDRHPAGSHPGRRLDVATAYRQIRNHLLLGGPTTFALRYVVGRPIVQKWSSLSMSLKGV